jgi:8-oxo-dGTP pyrophosphatase MutT (NUDIX family)
MATEACDDGKWTMYGKRCIYNTEWVKLELADVSKPSGERYDQHIVTCKAAVLIVLLDGSHDRVLMTRRHRIVHDKWSWEIPGGLIESGESPVDAALRELKEETGYVPARLDPILTYEPMIGTIRCPHHIFVGADPELVTTPTEKDEGLFQWVPLTEARKKIREGEIAAVGTLAAILYTTVFGLPD